MKKLYGVYNKSAQEYTYIKDADTGIEYVLNPFGQLVLYSNHPDLHDNKTDALFENVLVQLKSGRSFSNYKSSPYYKEYEIRLRKDYPEYLI